MMENPTRYQEKFVTMLFHGLILSFDRNGFRVHNIVIVASARQPALSIGFRTVCPEFGTNQHSGISMLNLPGIGNHVDRPEWFSLLVGSAAALPTIEETHS
jgi:hypothetical protein